MGNRYRTRTLALLETNLDDMNPEFFPHVLELLLEAGARDAWVQPVIMKHGRPGSCLTALCEPEKKEDLAAIIFAQTTTLGIRTSVVERLELERSTEEVGTEFGAVPIKVARDLNGTVLNASPEFSACRNLAQAGGRPVKDVYFGALAAWISRR